MCVKQVLDERKLAALAKRFRQQAGKTKAKASLELGVNSSTMHLAEEAPEQSLTKLRCRIIHKYSPYKVIGPVYLLKRK
jgi:DNA-binding XRE family transcriptional regulator